MNEELCWDPGQYSLVAGPAESDVGDLKGTQPQMRATSPFMGVALWDTPEHSRPLGIWVNIKPQPKPGSVMTVREPQVWSHRPGV